jgi:hypothetical protein
MNVARFCRPLLAAALACGAGPGPAYAQESFIGRPIYSEPGSGMQMPPGCQLEPTWRARIGTSDLEVWVVDCGKVARAWLVRRSLIEMIGPNQGRLRFVVLDEKPLPDETAGETLSVQCVGRAETDGGYVVTGAKWRPQGKELRLSGADSVLRADPITKKFVASSLNAVECTRYPEREAMMRRLQQGR